MPKYDITFVTYNLFINPEDDFGKDTISDDLMLIDALKKRGITAIRKSWDDPEFNWAETRFAVFRTPWDYFSRYDEFEPWFERTSKLTEYVNSYDVIKWNIDKHYLLELIEAGVNIPPALFVEPGDKRTLAAICEPLNWDEFILKPAVSGGAWHTYKFNKGGIAEHEKIFSELIKTRSMMLQEFQKDVSTGGEISFLLFGGKYSHAVLKRTAKGDFRVQAFLGGTVENYFPTQEEIKFAEDVISKSRPGLHYARVDVMKDNNGKLALIELEVFEPELWMRRYPKAIDTFADTLAETARR